MQYCVPYTRTHLFDRPLLVLQQLPRENMQCWIRSAEEAISTQQSREALHGELSRRIMAKFLARQTQSPSTTIVSLNQPISSLSGVLHLTLNANTGKTPSGIHPKLCSRGRPRPIHRTSRLGQQRQCQHEVSSSIVRHLSMRNPVVHKGDDSSSTSCTTSILNPIWTSKIAILGHSILQRRRAGKSPSNTIKMEKSLKVLSRAQGHNPKQPVQASRVKVYSLTSFRFVPKKRLECKPSRSQADQASRKQDYSGSLLSIVP